MTAASDPWQKGSKEFVDSNFFNLKHSIKRTDGTNFTGMVGMAQRGEVDAALDGFTITNERSQAVDFSTSYTSQILMLAVKRPDGGARSDMFSMAKIFTPVAWIFVLGTYILLCLAIGSFLSWETWIKDAEFKKEDAVDGIAIVLKAAVMSGYDKIPNWIPGRIVTISTLLFGTLIFTYYSGNFLTELAVQKEALPKVQSMEDVLQPGIKIGTYPNTYVFSAYFLS